MVNIKNDMRSWEWLLNSTTHMATVIDNNHFRQVNMFDYTAPLIPFQ